MLLLWGHVPLIFALAMWLESDWLWPTFGTALFAGITTFCCLKFPDDLMTRLTGSVAYIAIIALVLYLMHGRDWQIDVHMYFFAGLAILSIYCDWRVIIMGAVAIACHHLVLNFLLPAAVYPNGGDFLRVVLHAVIVVLEAVTLTWMTYKMETLLAANEQSIVAMDEAQERERALQAQQENLRVRTENEEKLVMSKLADDFETSVKVTVDTMLSTSKGMQATARELSMMAQGCSTLLKFRTGRWSGMHKHTILSRTLM